MSDIPSPFVCPWGVFPVQQLSNVSLTECRFAFPLKGSTSHPSFILRCGGEEIGVYLIVFTESSWTHTSIFVHLQESSNPQDDGHPSQPLAGAAEGAGGRRGAWGSSEVQRSLHLLAACRYGG